MANYKWVINAVDCYTAKDGLENVAYNVHWSYMLTEGEHSVSMIGVQSIGSPNPENFVAFEDLTEDDVISWISASMDVEQMQANLDKQIEDLFPPKVVTLQLKKPVIQPVEEQVAENVTDEPIVE